MNWKIKTLMVIAALAGVVYVGLPLALRAAGLHPHYELPKFNLAGKRALVITTSHSTLGETGKATGVFGSEMSVPYYAFLDAGMEVDIASIKGGEVPVEPFSMGWPLASPEDYRFTSDSMAMAKLRSSIPIAQVDISKYDAVFMAGGWGAAYDFAQSDELAKLVTAANAKGNAIGSVCHGALGLVNAKGVDGSLLVAGRRVTGVTDRQVKQLGIEITPKHPETELRAAKAIYESKSASLDIFATHVSVDRNLITGQNQNSGWETSHRMLEFLAAK
jgi:putative intracellular protease/amidase